MNTSAFGVERGTLFRVPATANLMIDSADRNSNLDASGVRIVSPWNFTISKNQALIQGFFSRIGVSEVVLEWCIPNISQSLGNDSISIIDSSGTTRVVGFPDNNYTVAEALSHLSISLGAFYAGNPAYSWGTVAASGGVEFTSNINNIAGAPPFRVVGGKLAAQLGLNLIPNQITPPSRFITVDCPDLRPYRYIDFVCNQLTAVQDVKDASTNLEELGGSRDVLVRWYFADDYANSLDSLGFPILPGYTKFVQRRLYNPPKQIKWEQNFPLAGFLEFQVYTDSGQILVYENSNYINTPQESNWLMTLQLSEG